LLLQCDAAALQQHIATTAASQSQAEQAAASHPDIARFDIDGKIVEVPTKTLAALTGNRFLQHLCSTFAPEAVSSPVPACSGYTERCGAGPHLEEPLALSVHLSAENADKKGGNGQPPSCGGSPTLIKASSCCNLGELDALDASFSVNRSAPASMTVALCFPDSAVPAAVSLFDMYTGSCPSVMSVRHIVQLLQICGYICDLAVSSGLSQYLAPCRGSIPTGSLFYIFAAVIEQQQFMDTVASTLAVWLSDDRHDTPLFEGASAFWATMILNLSPSQAATLMHASAGGARPREQMRTGSTMRALLAYSVALTCDGCCEGQGGGPSSLSPLEGLSTPAAARLLPRFLVAVDFLCPCRRACVQLAMGSTVGASLSRRLHCVAPGQPVVMSEGERVAFVVRVPFCGGATAVQQPAWTNWAVANLDGQCLRWRLRHRVREDTNGTRSMLLSFDYEELNGCKMRRDNGGADMRHFGGRLTSDTNSQLSVAIGCWQSSAQAVVEHGILKSGEPVLRSEVSKVGLLAEIFNVDRGFGSTRLHSFVVHSSLDEESILKSFVDEDGMVLMCVEVAYTL
jgi:hypothetical protein